MRRQLDIHLGQHCGGTEPINESWGANAWKSESMGKQWIVHMKNMVAANVFK